MTTKHHHQCNVPLPESRALCVSSVWTVIIIIGLCVVACVCAVLPASLLWTLGYEERQAWTDNSIKTTCTVIGRAVEKTCNIKYSACWAGKIHLQHLILEPNYTYYRSWETAFGGANSYDSALRRVESKYPDGTLVKCYYLKSVPSNIKLGQPEPTVYLAFAIIFTIIACIILCVAIFIVPPVSFLCAYIPELP